MTTGTLKSFEESMHALEEIVRRLERGDLTLEEALAAFETGVQLVKALNERLSAVEARVEILTRGESGDLRLTPMHDESKE